MINRLKNKIKAKPNLYYSIVMSVGPYIRFVYFKQFIKRYLKDDNYKVLDAGFGRGEHLHWLEDKYPQCELIGYDLAETTTYLSNFDIANQRLKHSNLKKVDLHLMEDRDKFDLIFTIDVLEHIPDNHLILANFYRALKSGGYLYLAMPYDDENDNYILPQSLLQQFIHWTDEEHIGEMRSVEDTSILLEELGFNVEIQHYTFTTPVRILWEIQQIIKKLPAQFILFPIFNFLARIEFLLPHPNKGSIRLIARKP